MSLINQALQDLDARSSESPNIDVDISGSDVKKSAQKNTVYLGLLIIAAIGVAYTLGRNEVSTEKSPEANLVDVGEPVLELQNTSPPSATESIVAVSEPAETPRVETPQATDRNVIAEKKIITEADKPETVNSNAVILAATLNKGYLALERNRLTLPIGESALAYFNQALLLDPQSIEAKIGLKKIGERFQQLISLALTEKKLERFEYLVSRAETAGIVIDDIAVYQASYAALLGEIEASRNNPESVDVAFSVGAEGSVSIQKTLATQDNEMAEAELARFRKGERQSSRANLSQFIAANPTAQKSRLALFNIYLQEGDLSAAALLANTDGSSDVLTTYMQARILVAEKKLVAASVLLSTQKFSSLRESFLQGELDKTLYENFISLQAALYQRQNENLLAAEKYQQLIRLDSSNGQYWLGLAVSADALQHSQNALSAYNQVIALGGISGDVEKYVQSRVKVLSASDLKPEIAGAVANP